VLQIGESAASLSSPLDHLIACHKRIEQRLATLERAGMEFPTRPEEANEAIRSAIQFMETNGARHTEDEEESLFPRLLPALSVEERSFVAALEAQHQNAERVFDELKQAATALPGSAGDYVILATELRTIYREHIEAEEELLIPLARRVLSEEQTHAIGEEMSARRAERSC